MPSKESLEPQLADLELARIAHGHSKRHVIDDPCVRCAALANVFKAVREEERRKLDEAIREARLTEAEIWNETLKVQDLRVCDIFWSKTRLARLREGKT